MLDAWRQRPPVAASNWNERRTHRTDKKTKSETKQTKKKKKRKNTICVVWMWILFVRFFSQVYFCCFLLSAWDLRARARTRHLCSPATLRLPPSPHRALYFPFALPVYVILFMLPCLHGANCAIFKRPVLVFSIEFWTEGMSVRGWVDFSVIASIPTGRYSVAFCYAAD